MARRADGASFVIEVIAISAATVTLEVSVEHKNTEDPDSSAATAATFGAAISSTGTFTKSGVTGLKELVRYKYVVSHEPEVDGWIHFRPNPPIWLPN